MVFFLPLKLAASARSCLARLLSGQPVSAFSCEPRVSDSLRCAFAQSPVAGSKQAKSKLKLVLGWRAILPAKGEAEEQGSLRLKMLARSQPFCGSQTASKAMAVMNAVFYLACWLTIAPL